MDSTAICQAKKCQSQTTLKSILSLTLFLCLISIVARPQPSLATTSATNVILFIGDGMGPEHVRAGGMLANGAAGSLVFETFSNQTVMTHNNVSNAVTDSAAAATSMATGVKVNNGVISLQIPGDGSELETVLERHQGVGKSTGLITTSYMTDASTAAFGAHEPSRGNTAQIAADFLTQTRPNVLLGGGGGNFDSTGATAAGYTWVSDRNSLLALDTSAETYVAGAFGSSELPPAGMPGRDDVNLPTLPEMVTTALNILDNNPNGLFLVIEHEGTDTHSHSNNTEPAIRSVVELADAVQAALTWRSTHPNTLILITADHETGDLSVTETNPQAGVLPAVTWGSGGHTPTPVPVYAIGIGSQQVVTGQPIDNIAISEILSPFVPTVVQTEVAQSSDDVEERLSDGVMYVNSSDLELGTDTQNHGVQAVGLRFRDVAVPADASISNAYIEFTTDEVFTDVTNITIAIHEVDDAQTFTSTVGDVTGRPTLGLTVPWSVPVWNTVGETHQTPNLKTLLQPIVTRPGWRSGNSMSFELSGTGHRTAVSFDGDNANGPRLYIEYTVIDPTSVELSQQPAMTQPDTQSASPFILLAALTAVLILASIILTRANNNS